MVLGQSISRGVATLGVEDHATQTAQDEGTQTDLSHVCIHCVVKSKNPCGVRMHVHCLLLYVQCVKYSMRCMHIRMIIICILSVFVCTYVCTYVWMDVRTVCVHTMVIQLCFV